MTEQNQFKCDGINFVALYERYAHLSKSGDIRSQLSRHISHPAELHERAAFYQLFPGEPLPEWLENMVFLLPFFQHNTHALPLGKQLAKKGVSEARLLQVVRADYPRDIIQLRRLINQIKPAGEQLSIDWQKFGKALYWWKKSPNSKRRLLEDFFVEKFTNK